MPARPDPVVRIHGRRASAAHVRAKDGVWRALVRGFLQQWVAADATVVDLGCGAGEFLRHVRCRRRIGVDVRADVQAADVAGVEFVRGSAAELGFLPDGSVDVVFTSNMLEHLDGKAAVERVVAESRRVLRPGGTLIAMGPNARLLHGLYWDFWDHHTPLTDRALCELLDLMGFLIVDCQPRFMPYTTFSRLPKSAWLVSCYLRLRPAWRWWGRQFLILARKPGA